MEKVLYILNPVSGRGADRKLAMQLLEKKFPSTDFKLLETNGKSDKKRIEEELRKNDYPIVIIGGGDGTINMVAGVLLKEHPSANAGIMPLGSANGLARCLGIEDIPTAIEALAGAKTRKVNILKMGNKICLHLADFGFNAGLIKKFEKEDERGMLSYFKSSLKQFMEMRPYDFSLKLDGKDARVQARMLVIANGDRYGTGAIINPMGKIDDGKMEIIAFNPDGFDDMVSISVALYSQEVDHSEVLNIWSCKEVEITNHDSADFHIDGEVQTTPQTINIHCRQETLKFFSLI